MWERPVNRKLVAGVASGISEGMGVGKVWVRLGFIVLAFMAGIGFILYGIGWVVMPRQGEDESIVDRLVDRANEPKEWVSIGLIVLGVLLLAGNLQLISSDVIFAGGLIAIGIVLYTTNARDANDDDPTPSGGSPPEATTTPDSGEDPGDESESLNDDAPVEAGASSFASPDGALTVTRGPAVPYSDVSTATTIDRPTRQHSARTDRRRRRRSVLPRLTFGVLLLVIGALGMYHASIGFVKDVDYVAAALGIVGVGVLVSSVWGRARWLVPLGLLLMPLLFVVNLMQVSVIGPWGEFFEDIETITTLEESYSYGGGEVVFRLDGQAWERAVDDVSVRVELGVGSVTLFVPDDVNVVISADIGLGSVENVAIPPEDFDVASTNPFGNRDWRLRSPTFVSNDRVVFRQLGNPGPTAEFDINMGLGTVSIYETEVGE